MEGTPPEIDLSVYQFVVEDLDSLTYDDLPDMERFDADRGNAGSPPPDGDYPPVDLDPDISHDYSTGEPPRKRSQHEIWCEKLLTLGASMHHAVDGIRSFTIIHGDSPPPLLPQPRGPSPGADVTLVYDVPGQDIKHTHGSAVIGGKLIHGNVDSISFMLFDMSDVASQLLLTRAFDHCRLDEIQLRFVSRNQDYPVSPLALAAIVDRHATELGPHASDIAGRPGAVLVSSHESFDVIFRPRLPGSAVCHTSATYWEDPDRWNDISHVKPHFGVQIAMLAPPLAAFAAAAFDPAVYSWDISARYKVSFLSTRRSRRSPPPDLDD